MKKSFSFKNSILITLLVFISSVVLGQTTFSWTGSTSTAWLTSGNWSPSGPPNTTTSEALFNNNTNAGTNGINMNGISAARSSIGAIHFGSSATTARTINNSSGTVAGTFTLNGITINSVANTIIRNNSATTHIVANGSQNLNIALGNSTNNVIAIDAAGGINISSVISGANPLTKVGGGAGVLTLSGTNTYTGATTINAGTLSFATIANGGSNSNIGASSNAAGNLVLGGGTLQYTGANASTDRNFTLTAATTSTINTTNTLTISGSAASTSGALTKTGAGGLTLTGTNLYTGLTTVSAGTLTLNKTGGGTIPSTNNVTVTGGTFRVSSNQTINNLTVSSGATVTVDAGVTLTINGTFSQSGNSVTGTGTIAMGSNSVLRINQGGWPGNTCTYTYNASATLEFANTSGSYGIGATDTWWPAASGPANVNVSGAGGITLNVSRTIPSGGLMQTSATTNIASGVTLTMNGTFQINQGGWGGNTGTYTYGATTGTLVFNNTSGPYGVNSGDTWWPTSNGPYNVTVQGGGGITMNVARTVPTTGTTGTFLLVSGTNAVQGTALTLNGTTQINGGNFQTSPTYGSSSTLIYNTGGAYGTSNEWTGGASTSVAAGSGIPANVTISSASTNVTLAGGRGVPGNITVNASTILALNASSGDLYLGGHFAMNGTLTNNSRAVFFVLGNAQSITSSNANVTFDFLLVNKTGSTTVTLDKPVIVNNTLTLTAGFFDLATNDMTVGTTSGGSSTGYVRTSSTGQLKRTVTSSAVLFPIGNSAYNPISLTNSGTSDTYGIVAKDGTVPNAIDDTKAVNRYWAVTEGTTGGGNLIVTAQFNTADGAGASYSTATNPQFIGLYPNTSPWSQQSSGAAASGSNPYTVSASGFTNSLPTSGSTYYFAVGNSGAFSSATPPTITASGGVVTSSPGSGTSGYVGNTVTINGTGLGSVTVVKVGGSGGTTVSILSQSSTTLTFAAINLSGQIYVQNSGGNTTSTETYTNLGYITTTTGAWGTAGTWLGGSVPPSTTTTDIVIAHNVTSTSGTTDLGKLTINGSTTLTITASTSVNINTASTNSGTITNNGTLSTAATYTNSGTITINGTFQINQGGFASGGTWTYGSSSTLVYNNSSGPYGSIDAGHTYWPASSGPVNVTVQGGGGINMGVSRTVSGTFLLVTGTNAVQGTALTLNGTTQINGGNFQTTPTYGSSSTLIYNSSGTYGISNEWTGSATTAGSGIPFNVTIQNATTITFPSTNRGIGGNFNIVSGGATLNATSGDLYVAGNFTNNGTFTHNTRAVFLNGTTQTLGGSNINGSGTTNCFPFLILQNGTNVTLAGSAAVTNTLTLTSGKITLSTFDLNLGSSAISGATSSNYIVTSSTGQLKRTVTSAAVSFPVGNSAYNPITFTNAGTSDIYGIRIVDGAPANAADALVTVQRSWYITEAVAGNSDLTPVVAQYSSGEVGANYNAGTTPYMGLFNGTSWSQVATTLGGSITATSTGTNQFPATIPAGSYIALGKDAGLTSTPPTISSFTTSGYSGSSIVISGTNFTGATAVSFGGTAAASFTVDSPTQITAVVGSGGSSGNVMVTTPSGSVSLAGFTYLGFITTSGASNWNTGASWLGGAVPTANSAVIIAHNLSIDAAFTNTPIASITVNTGITTTASSTVAVGTVTNAITTVGTGVFTFTGASGSIIAGSFVNGGTLSWSAAGTLNISAGGTLTNNGTFTRGTGTVNFVGSAGIINGSNAITFNNLTNNSGGLTLTTVPTIDGTLQLNGGFVSASPIYTANSTLYYNLSYNRFNEWSATGVGTIGTTAGYPNNVTINAGTFDIVNGSNLARALNGTLTVNTGATFNLNALNAALTIGGGLATVGTGAFNMGSTNTSVTVTGSVTNAGNLTLSSTSGSDLYVAGNFTNNGTFTHNTRAVFLNGTTQTISGSALNTSGTTNCFDYLFILNNSQVTLGAAVAIRNNLTFTSGDIILNTFNLTLAGGATITGASSSNYVITNNTGMLVRTLATSTAVTFPIGNSAYNPITISQSGASDAYSFRMIDGSISGLSPNDVSRTINRRWSASRTSSSNVNITVSSISYNSGEENNATNFNAGTQPYYGLYNGTSWVHATAIQASQTFTSANTVASSTATSFSVAMGKDLAFLLLTPTLTTTTATNFATTSASSGGTSISAGGGTITSKGVAYATTPDPTTPTTSDGSGTADFSASLSGLTPNTVYNYRAFATNSFGVTGYGSNLNFTTLHNAPTVGSGSGATQTAITTNWTAPTGGGSATYTFEVAISTASDFSSTLSTQTGISSGTLTYQFTGLTAGTTYYFRVRANNTGGSSAWSSISSGYATLSDAIQLTALGTSASENFNTLASTGTSSTTPTGWYFNETDSNADGIYATGTGSSATGNTYSFGDASNSERAFGTLFSSSLTSTIGAKMINSTGSTINNLFIDYTGETWRVGAASRSDRLDFQYSLDATSLTTGTWLDFDALDYTNSGQATANGSLQQTSAISNVIIGLSLTNGSVFWIRWNDFNASGADDAMAIDNISIKPCGTVSAPTASAQGFCSTASATVASLVATGTAIQWYSASTGGTALATSTALTTGTYYASQTLSGCESVLRTSVAVTITTPPNAGTLSGTQAICSNGSTTFTSNGNSGGAWTSGSTGVATINSTSGLIAPVAAGISTMTYTVTGTGGCSNATATRDVTVTSAPNAGTLSGLQGICSNGSTTFTSNGDVGSWTSGSTGVATINSSTGVISPVAAGTSTITYTVTGSGACSNATATRDVTVTTNPSAPTGSASQSFCSASSPTIASLSATGTSIQWYAASSGGSALSSSASLANGTTYYATQTTSSCESTSRFAVTANVTSSGLWIGGTSGNWNDAANWCGGIPNSTTVVVEIPSGVTVTLNTTIDVLNLTIASGGGLNLGSNSFTIANGGSITNNGTINAGTSNLIFSGAGTITASGLTLNNLVLSGSLTLNNATTVNGKVTLNNGATINTSSIVYGSDGVLEYSLNSNITSTNLEWPTTNSPKDVVFRNNSNVTLNSNKTIEGSLTMVSGNIITSNSALLEIGSSSSVLGSITWTAGTILGPLKRWFGTSANSTQASGIFPVGTSDQNRLAVINFTQATDGGYIIMDYKIGTPSNSTPTNPFGLPMSYVSGGQTNYIQNADLTGYWDITPYSSAGVEYGALDANTFDITLRINSDVIQSNPVTANPPGMRIIRAKGNPSAAHDPFEIGATAATITQVPGSDPGTDFYVRSNGLEGFSWFNIGGDNETPLPVELLSFIGNCENNQTQLIWKTASENNSDYFEVLKSQDGENWRIINTQAAAGFSSILQTYLFIEQEKSSTAYYRLNQVDIDGDYKMYDPIFIDCQGNGSQLITYPNPSKEGFNIAISDSKLVGESTLIIRDAMGKVVTTKSISIADGMNLFPIAANEIENGVYFITIEKENNNTKTIKHVKN